MPAHRPEEMLNRAQKNTNVINEQHLVAQHRLNDKLDQTVEIKEGYGRNENTETHKQTHSIASIHEVEMAHKY